ncbi:MAG: flavodoxin domain-containing protein [Anaerolineae bacterium]
MKVLVAYATAHGSSVEIAHTISEVLKAQGAQVTVEDVRNITHVNGYDVYVMGTPIHAGTWLPEIKGFIRAYQPQLEGKPVYFWISCVRVMEEGGMEHVKEFYMVPEMLTKMDLRLTAAFAGKLALDDVDWHERWTLAARYDGNAWPSSFDGDFRDWDKIKAWAGEVAEDMKTLQITG